MYIHANHKTILSVDWNINIHYFINPWVLFEPTILCIVYLLLKLILVSVCTKIFKIIFIRVYIINKPKSKFFLIVLDDFVTYEVKLAYDTKFKIT